MTSKEEFNKMFNQELSEMTKQQLCDYCRAHKIKGYSGKTKAQRVDLIMDVYSIKTTKSKPSTLVQTKTKAKKTQVKEIRPKITVNKEITYLEFRGGTSKKYYEIQFIDETTLQIRHGRIGVSERIIINKFGSRELARKQYDKTVRSKLAKGYTEIKYAISYSSQVKKGIKPKKSTSKKPTSKKPSRPKSTTSGSKRINPMLAAQGDQFLGDPNYIVQQKYDGTRCIIIKKGGTIKMIGRSWKNDYASNFPEIVADIRKIPHPAFILDSELTFFKGKKDVFLTVSAKKETKKGYIAKCMVFDILEYRDKDVRDQTLAVRSLLLSKIVPKGLKHLEVVKSYATNHKKFFEEIVSDESQGEGVILKRLDSKYNEGGRDKSWIKVKKWRSDEAIVVGVTHGKGTRGATFGSLILAQFDEDSLKFVGKTSGFTETEQLIIIDKLRPHITRNPQLIGFPSKKVKYWVYPEIVVEVKYQERTPDGKFRFPSFLRIRTDKVPKECIIK